MHAFARRLAGRAFGSLAARIGFFVFAATLTSALAVAGTTAHALRGFLRAKVEQRLPEAVLQVEHRLDLWYAQRALDVQVFARSATVVDGLARYARSRAGDAQARAEVETYLRYVLQGLPDYASIFVLDAKGDSVLWVGTPAQLGAEAMRELARVRDASISGVLRDADGGAHQAVSTSVLGRDGRMLFTLHALLPVRALADQLTGAAAAAVGRTLVFDEEGRFVAGSVELPPAAQAPRTALDGAPTSSVLAYAAPDGERVVGSALPLSRLGWTIVLEEEYGAAFAPIAIILQRTLGLNLGIVIVLAGLAFAVVRALVRPLHALSDCAQRLRDGDPGVELPVVRSVDEVGILARSFREMVESLTHAKELQAQLAITDGLTKIHNHRYFQDQLAIEIKRCERSKKPLALVLLDIDDFKALNDSHGHDVGDAVLERLAAVLVSETRQHDVVARYGGEEFAILAPETDRNGGIGLAEKLRAAVGRERFDDILGFGTIAATVSVGVSVYHGDRRAFFREADRALYAAKNAGKDCVMAAEDADSV